MEQTKQYEYVDLGLPSGLKWGKCNVGAEKETDYGYYFQWGDIEDKTNSDCRWESYNHCNGSHNKLTKYCVDNKYGSFGTVDNKTTLDLKDDAATQIMGGDWRMPTKDELKELVDNTDKAWTQVNGVNGCTFTSKKDTSKHIFIPAAGYCSYGSMGNVGSRAYVLSSSLDTSDPRNAWSLMVRSGNYNRFANNRSEGKSVRGVRA